MTNRIEDFIIYATKYGGAIEQGDHKLANKFHGKLMAMYPFIREEGRFDQMIDLTKSTNENIKLWAATFLLRTNEEVALKALNELKLSPAITGLTASTTIDLWKKGLLRFS